MSTHDTEQATELAGAVTWQTTEDERHRARTDDGWNIGLYHYRPDGAARGLPVLLGHGLAGSRYIFDAHEDYSMARALAARGLDVWLVDLRGRNASWPDGGPEPELQWTFDDFVFRDVPAVTDYVAAATGRDALHWVGTEMSGLALYATVISGSAPRLAGGVTMGSPAITPPEGEVPGVTTPFPQRSGTRYPFSMVREVGPQLARDRSEVLDSSFLTTNTDWVVTARYFAHGVPDEATGIVDQFRDWMEHTTMRSVGHSVVWSDRLAEFDRPVLLIAGAADRQRPPAGVVSTHAALGSADRTLVVAGEASGWPIDVGHDDLLAGLTAPTHTFPLVADWLLAHG
ncbi:MAG TPA: alpha/beta fold hydrolase [Acidimicrobiia bacterium]|nr:alpha/beta fold hydrolase [Acidimicrobiia bacterium]